MTIWERVKNALSPLGVPITQNEYQVTNGEYPDLYLVYSMVVGSPDLHADDAEFDRLYLMNVAAYCRFGLANLPDVKGAMLIAGFTASAERELAHSETTGHYGWSMDFYWLEDL